jgi:HlyD family secretion protein
LRRTEIYVATKYAGRVKTIMFNEGDTVEAGQVVARMDTSALDAQLRQEQAQIIEAENSRKVALAQIAVKQADYNYAQSQYQRSKQLVTRGAVGSQEAEIDNAGCCLHARNWSALRRKRFVPPPRLTPPKRPPTGSRPKSMMPCLSRRSVPVFRRISEPGEVLGEGGRVFSIADLSDVYMYVFLPDSVTGKIKLGSEARLVLDAAPQYPIRAVVSYVSPTAQFHAQSG